MTLTQTRLHQTCDIQTNPNCNAPAGATGGFQLAMRFSSKSAFTFYSEYWTNCALLDALDMSPCKDADGKFATFNNVVAKQIRGCLPNGCVTYTLPTPMTLHELFTSTPVGSLENLQFAPQTSSLWVYISGASALATGWTGTGVNYDDDYTAYKGRVRFGALFNDQATVTSANDAVGFGATEANGQSVGAGWTWYPSHQVPTQGTIWVKGVEACSGDGHCPPCRSGSGGSGSGVPGHDRCCTCVCLCWSESSLTIDGAAIRIDVVLMQTRVLMCMCVCVYVCIGAYVPYG